MTKEQAINKIQNTPYVYLNDDQKKIAIGIINSIPNGQDVLAYFDFIMKRADVGFKFDVAPEIAAGRIAVVNEMKEHNINTDPKTVDIDENKLIIGDNYEALKNLLLTHKEKIDVIYIDPPYNTEKSKEDGNTSSKEGSASKFIYKDKFGRNGWLNMMRDRLVLAKRLLSPEGVIFVSIDDSEQAYLKVLMDDIFGEECFVSNLPRIETNQGKNDVKTIANRLDWVLVYSKTQKLRGKMINTSDYKFDDNDGLGPYHLKTHLVANQSLGYVKSLDFDVDAFGKTFKPIDKNGRNRWRWNKERIEKALKLNLLVERGPYLYQKSYLYYDYKVGSNELVKREFKTRPFSSAELIDNKFSNKEGTKSIKEIGLDFSMPKPPVMIEELINLSLNEDSLVLDFFAGSGTTAQAVMELNKKDNGNRKFILVTNNENNIGLDITYERIYRVIKGETTKGSKDFKWLEKNTPFENEKLRVFNIKHFDVETDQSDELENITNMAIENIKKLNPLYDSKDSLQVYYDLDGLNPITEAQKEQLYSTDAIKHRISNNIKDSNKKYCTCGKSFIKIEDFDKHIGESNDN